jgi:hypothetical protein
VDVLTSLWREAGVSPVRLIRQPGSSSEPGATRSSPR